METGDCVVLYMTLSKDQQKIGIVLGRNLPTNEQEVHDLVIMRKRHKSMKFNVEI